MSTTTTTAGTTMATGTAAGPWSRRPRKRVLQSVFQMDISQPTPYLTPSARFAEHGMPFGGPETPGVPTAGIGGGGVGPSGAAGGHTAHPPQSPSVGGISFGGARPGPALGLGLGVPTSPFQQQQPQFPTMALPPSSPASHGEDQVRWDRAWHAVTTRIQLPAGNAAEDSFGLLVGDSFQSGGGGGGGSSALGVPLPHPLDLDEDGTGTAGRARRAGGGGSLAAALRVVLFPARHVPSAQHTESPIAWHGAQCRAHLAAHVLPLLAACDDRPDPRDVLLGSLRTLEAAHRLYAFGLGVLVGGIEQFGDVDGAGPGMAAAQEAVEAFRRDLHAVVANSMSDTLVAALRWVVEGLVRETLALKGRAGTESAEASAVGSGDEAKRQLLQLVESLGRVGLAGERFQVLFAEIMDRVMRDYIRSTYAEVWNALNPSDRMDMVVQDGVVNLPSPSYSIVTLCEWVETQYHGVIAQVFDNLDGTDVSAADVETWKDMAVGRLAGLRISELFDIVASWPNAKGGLDDLRASVTTPQRRLHLTDTFSAALSRRLLHPGRSTLEILRVYIAMIRTFHVLDPSKVLLNRVVSSLQLYLHQRDDAVRIIVTGLLCSLKEASAAAASANASSEASPGTGITTTGRCGKLWELSLLLNDPSQQGRRQGRRRSEAASGGAAGTEPDDELDWDDMNWIPDPVDAGVNYRRPRSEDVIGTMIGTLGSQDTFIREFQAVMAERLLSPGATTAEDDDSALYADDGQPMKARLSSAPDAARAEFAQEAQVLDLLKKRFGEAPLQSCDVMLRDVADSRSLNAVISRLPWPLPRAPDAAPTAAGAATPEDAAPNQEQQQRQAAGPEQPAIGTAAAPGLPAYEARILSRLYWPTMGEGGGAGRGRDDDDDGEAGFSVPPPVREARRRFEAAFRALKASRRLAWLPHLGSAAVELEFADGLRFAGTVATHEAAVVYEFGDGERETDGGEAKGKAEAEAASSDEPKSRTVQQLADSLKMHRDLVLAALEFWESKKVLRRVADETYTVVERLADLQKPPPGVDSQGVADGNASSSSPRKPTGGATAALSGPSSTAKTTSSGGGGADEAEQARRQVYWQFIVGMLTNASPTMPLAQMAMMLRMLISDGGGFRWSNEQLQEFLADKVADGDLEVVAGGKFKLVKK